MKTVSAFVTIREIGLTNISLEDTVNAIHGALNRRSNMKIAFINADCINIASKNYLYRNALKRMDWVFIDGIGMKLAGWILKKFVRDNVNGTDLFPRLCKELEKDKRKIYLLGAKPGTASKVEEWVNQYYPGLEIVGTHHGYFGKTENNKIINDIKNSGADILFVGCGAPFQEIWIDKYFFECNVPIVLGVGGLFDYYSGNVSRAPLWMRYIGLEWFYRFLQEPKRLWYRYLIGNWIFIGRILYEKIIKKRPINDRKWYSNI